MSKLLSTIAFLLISINVSAEMVALKKGDISPQDGILVDAAYNNLLQEIL